MTAQEFEAEVKSFAQTMGWKPGENSGFRSAIQQNMFNDGKAWFGFVAPEQPAAGAYGDFSLVFFPSSFDDAAPCIVTLCVGSQNFERDFDLAKSPGVRRRFLSLIKHEKLTVADYPAPGTDAAHIKTSMTDLKNGPAKKFFQYLDGKQADGVQKSYASLMQASTYFDPALHPSVWKEWVAAYAEMRGWGNQSHAKARRDVLSYSTPPVDTLREVRELLDERRYVILQGAPGVGKTYTAKRLAHEVYGDDNVIFQQFHASTTYSDFVCGIRPKVDATELTYELCEGALCQAIRKAQDNPGKKILLIIDEINRANLATVLGPVFYLFEPSAPESAYTVNIGDLRLTRMPENLHVLGTMNTADRSLAVVDFALRRRFAWYTILPQMLEKVPGKKFHKKDFTEMADIFFQFADDSELSLQPGPSYFLTNIRDDKKELDHKMRYELMPLLKEYFAEGMIPGARDAVSNYFLQRGLEMYR